MRGLRSAVRVFCIVPFATGGYDLLNGVGLLKASGVALEPEAMNDPVLNSQVKFWGAIWLGYGIVLWYTSSRLTQEATLFKLLCGVLGLSGVARLAASIQYGLPGTVLTGAMIVELVGSTALFGWHAAALQRPNDAT